MNYEEKAEFKSDSVKPVQTLGKKQQKKKEVTQYINVDLLVKEWSFGTPKVIVSIVS